MKRFINTAILASLFISSVADAALDRFENVAPGIYRGDQPDTLSDYKMLKSLGVKTIINLRMEKNFIMREAEIADKIGFGFLSFPINALTYPDKATIDSVLLALTDPSLQPVYVHCQHGRDRTGLVIGLYRTNFEGWNRNHAWAEMIDRGYRPVLVGLSKYFFEYGRPQLVVADEISNRQ